MDGLNIMEEYSALFAIFCRIGKSRQQPGAADGETPFKRMEEESNLQWRFTRTMLFLR